MPADGLRQRERREGPVELTAERAIRLDPQRGEEGTGGYSVLVRRASGAESSLTGAQWAVAHAVARGLSDREIADSLQISTSTVHEHVAALHELLGTNTRPRLVAGLRGPFLRASRSAASPSGAPRRATGARRR